MIRSLSLHQATNLKEEHNPPWQYYHPDHSRLPEQLGHPVKDPNQRHRSFRKDNVLKVVPPLEEIKTRTQQINLQIMI